MRAMSICLLLSLSATIQAQVPTQWTVELVCRSSLDAGTPPYRLPYPSSLSSQYVALDDDGSIAIRTVLATATASEGIFVGSPSAGSVVLTTNNPGNPVWSTSIGHRNDRLAIAGPGVNGASLYDESGALVQAFPNGGPQGTANPSLLSLSSDGALCSRSDFGSNKKIIIDEFVGGTTRTQTLVADNFSGDSTFLFAPKMNDARQVVYNSIPSSGPERRIIRREPDGSSTTIVETGTVWNRFTNSTDIATDGQIAFTARRTTDSQWEVNRATPTSVTRIAQAGELGILGSDLGSFPPAINSNGLVAFRSKDATGATALFVGDGDSLVRIIGLGDTAQTDLGPIPYGFDFGGFTGVQVLNGIVDINDSNQVAFAAFLNNGTIGVFLATPANPCTADTNNDGLLTPADFTAWIAAFNSGAPQCDQNNDNTCDPADFTAWIANFNDGCP